MSFYKLLSLAYCLPISGEEWESKLLYPETAKKLGLRSLKISKLLLARGVPERLIQKVMLRKEESYFSNEWEEQGDSTHFSSCQARDPRAKWFEKRIESLWQEGDRIAAQKGWLHLWVVGHSMSKNGEGFLARAKVRMVYDTGGSLLGAFVDRVYGQQELLDIEDLKVLLKEKYGEEIPILRLHTGGNLKGKVPSSVLGYQDTFKGGGGEYGFSYLKGPFLDALQERLATPLWLRQEYRDVLEGKPPKRTKFRGKVEMEFPKKVKAFLGVPKTFRIRKIEEEEKEWVEYWEISQYVLTGDNKSWIFQGDGGWIHKKSNGLFVGEDIPQLGFYKPSKIKR